MKNLMILCWSILLMIALVNPSLAQKEEDDDDKEQEKFSTLRSSYKIRGDAYMLKGDELNALMCYDSALKYIDIVEKDKIATSIKKKKPRKYAKDYLEIIQRKATIHLKNESFILADSLFSWRIDAIKNGRSALGKLLPSSRYTDAVSDLAEVYYRQGNAKKADSLLATSENMARRAATISKYIGYVVPAIEVGLEELLGNLNMAGIQVSPETQQLINSVKNLTLTRQYVAIAKNLISPQIANFENSLPLRQDAIGRYIYHLRLSNKARVQLGNFADAQVQLARAGELYNSARTYTPKEKDEQESNKKQGSFIDNLATGLMPTDKANADKLQQKFEAKKEESLARRNVKNGALYLRERNGILDNWADIYIRQGNFFEADAKLNESLTGTEAILKSREGSDILLTAYESYLNREHYDKAEEWLRKAMTTYRTFLGAEHTSYIKALIKLGQLKQMQEQYLEAENIYQVAEELLAKSDAEIAKVDKITSESEKKVQKILLDYDTKVAAKFPLSVSLLSGKADLMLINAKYDKAEEYAKVIISRYKNNGLDRSRPYANALAQLIKAYDGLGQVEKAEQLREERRKLMKALLGEDNVEFSFDLLRETRLKTEDDKKIILNALESVKKQKGENSVSYANALLLAGQSYANIKDFSTSELYYERYTNLVKTLLGENSNAYAEAIYKYGLYYAKQKKAYSNALSMFEQSKLLYFTNLGQYHPNTLEVIGAVADLHADNSKIDSAEVAYRTELAGILYRVRTVFPSLSESGKEKFLGKMNNRLGIMQMFLLTQLPKKPVLSAMLYDELLATKALLFSTANKLREAIMNSDDQATKDNFKKLMDLQDFHSQALLKTPAELQQNKVNMKEIEEEISRLEKILSANELYSQSQEDKKYEWRQVQEKLKANEAAVEIVRIGTAENPTYVALVIKSTTKGYPEAVIFGEGKMMDDPENTYLLGALNFNKLAKQGKEKDITYSKYWRPLADNLKGISKLYLSVDGVYNQLNINAIGIPNPNPKLPPQKYIIEEIDLHYISSTRDLIEKPELSKPKKDDFSDWSVVLFGFPDYKASDSIAKVNKYVKTPEVNPNPTPKTRFFSVPINELPATEIEVKNIGDAFKNKFSTTNVEVYTKEQADEATMKKLNSPTLLHIATHGFFVTNLKESQNSIFSEKAMSDNPLLRTGLLLAGAENIYTKKFKDGTEDGVFTAYEAMCIKLDKTEMVVMSACETGLGKISNGEGVYGLQRAFQTAGAKTVLMSLWQVSDESTQKLMTAFYKHWLVTGDRRAAFKKAQLEIKNQYKMPYYWAPFVMVGQ